MEESTISDRLKRDQLITDDEMVSRYESLISLPRGPKQVCVSYLKLFPSNMQQGKYIANRNEAKSKGGSIDTKKKKNR